MNCLWVPKPTTVQVEEPHWVRRCLFATPFVGKASKISLPSKQGSLVKLGSHLEGERGRDSSLHLGGIMIIGFDTGGEAEEVFLAKVFHFGFLMRGGLMGCVKAGIDNCDWTR
jgi:hypothetical protein